VTDRQNRTARLTLSAALVFILQKPRSNFLTLKSK
jgi:hypothetical protein